MSKPSAQDTLWDNLKQIFFAIILAIIIKTSVVEAYKIPSQSMEDTLLVGDFLLANKFVYGARVPFTDWRLPAISDPKQGDVVIFIYPRDGVTKYIKRCVATPGDTVFIKDKVVYVNGTVFPLPEYGKYTDTAADGSLHIQPRQAGGMDGPRDNFGPYVVPANSYFMMGDNRDNSYDSRWWGVVNEKLVLGKALLIHWSWDEDIYPSPDVAIDDPLSVPRMFLYNTAHFAQKVRWNRLFRLIN